MGYAKLVKEIVVKTENKVGMMEKVCAAIAAKGANITALHAFGIDKEAIFRIVTNDNVKAVASLKAENFDVSEKDVVLVMLENKSGAAAGIGKKLREANIDIKYIYGSACDCGGPCNIIFNSSDNKKAVKVLG